MMSSNRVFKTVIALFATFCLGLVSASLAPSIVSLEVMLETDTKYISMAFTGHGLGFVCGSIIGGIVYDIINKELLFALSMLGVAITTACISYSAYLWEFVAVAVCRGFFVAIMSGGGNPYILTLWTGHRAKESLLQAVHFTWAIGSTVSPVIIKPFLVDLQATNTSGNCNSTNYTDSPADIAERVLAVRIPHLIISSIILISTITWFLLFSLSEPSLFARRLTTEERGCSKTNIINTSKTPHFKKYVLLFMFFFYFFYIWVESIPGSLFAAFVVKGLGWTNDQGALIMTVYWGSNCAVRFLGVFIALILPVLEMLVVDLVMVTIGVALLIFSPYDPVIVWLSAAMLGAGMATVYATGFLWAEQYMEITGAVTSVFLVAASTGVMTGPAFAAYLFDEFGHMYFAYVLLGASLLIDVTFVCAVIYTRKRTRNTPTIALEVDNINNDSD